MEAGLYCVGWIKRGPVGVLVTTTGDAVETADAIVSDLRAGRLAPASGTGVAELLKERSTQHHFRLRYVYIYDYALIA